MFFTPPLHSEDEAFVAGVCKGLAHPARIRILRQLLTAHACTCGELVGELPLAQSTVSQHLKVLRDAGLVRGEVEGPRTCYCVNRETVDRFGPLIRALLSTTPESS
jgi:DNA-binding transcriptional ArsR family regulator